METEALYIFPQLNSRNISNTTKEIIWENTYIFFCNTSTLHEHAKKIDG